MTEKPVEDRENRLFLKKKTGHRNKQTRTSKREHATRVKDIRIHQVFIMNKVKEHAKKTLSEKTPSKSSKKSSSNSASSSATKNQGFHFDADKMAVIRGNNLIYFGMRHSRSTKRGGIYENGSHIFDEFGESILDIDKALSRLVWVFL